MTQAQQAEQVKQFEALYDALSPEARRQLVQIMRDLKAQQDREAAQAAEAGRA